VFIYKKVGNIASQS